MGKRVLFVSEIKDPYFEDFSSTQIMTNNIIDGLIAVADDITFVALIDANCNQQNVIDYYGKKLNKVYVVQSHLNLTLHKNKYVQLMRIFQSWLYSKQYDNVLEDLFSDEKKYDMLISHSPTLEVISISKQIKYRLGIRYIQYWSDPYTIAGIFPENIGIKRKIHYKLEKAMLKIADEIIYGTKTLMEFQKTVFIESAAKMRYVDVSYCINCDYEVSKSEEKGKTSVKLIYAGDYFSVTRNIIPLYEAMKQLDGYELTIVGNSDVNIKSTDSITVLPRQPYQVVQNYEDSADVIVCLLNHSCIQLPGKIFYRAKTNQRILILLDGKYKDRFHNYLGSFERFDFCENTKQSIETYLRKTTFSRIQVKKDLIDRLNPVKICIELLNGGNMDE